MSFSSTNNRYHELLRGLYIGQPPGWLPQAAAEQWLLASERRRLDVARQLGEHFPCANLYAQAHLGSAVLEGVCAALVERPGDADSLLEMVDDAVSLWLTRQASRALSDVFGYDRFVRSAPAYVGPDVATLRQRFQLPAGYALARFDHDVVSFAKLIELLREHHAPVEYVRAYRPVERPQLLVRYEQHGAHKVLEISAGGGEP